MYHNETSADDDRSHSQGTHYRFIVEQSYGIMPVAERQRVEQRKEMFGRRDGQFDGFSQGGIVDEGIMIPIEDTLFYLFTGLDSPVKTESGLMYLIPGYQFQIMDHIAAAKD